MTDVTLESLHIDLAGLRDDLQSLRHDILRLESKIDSKPSLIAMFTAVIVVVFGMAGVIASTIVTLNALGFIIRH